jgi:hypothetical protein
LEFKQEIRRVLDELDGAMCDQVLVNFMEIIIACRASKGGGHMSDIIFHCETLTSPEENDIYIYYVFLKEIHLIHSRFKFCALFETPYIYEYI